MPVVILGATQSSSAGEYDGDRMVTIAVSTDFAHLKSEAFLIRAFSIWPHCRVEETQAEEAPLALVWQTRET